MPAKVIRPIRIQGQLAYVPLTQGYEAVIDAADVPLVDGFNWQAQVHSHNVYAFRNDRTGPRRRVVRMHRIIMGEPLGFEVDHKDSNGLNNRRSNLRVATTAQNQHNQRKRKDNTSGFKGVYRRENKGKWRARIMINGVRKDLGGYDTPEAAHDAYCEASAKYHKEFGRTE